MKNILILMTCLSLVLLGCKKESRNTIKENEDNYQVRYPVSFGVSSFETQTGTLSVQSSSIKVQALKDNFKHLYYYVTKQSDSLKIIKTIKQKFTDANFGMVTDTLPAGKYNIFIVGAARPDVIAFTADGNFGLLQGLFIAYEGQNFHRPPNSIGDNFYKKIALTVSKPGSQNINLDRIVGKVNVKILDAIPTGVSKIVVHFNDVPDQFDLYSGAGAAMNSDEVITMTYIVKAADVGKKGLIIGDYFWQGSLYVDISYYDAGGNLVDQKLPTGGYELKANTIVTFSGKLFSLSTGFNIGVNSDWSKEINLPFEF